jgi:hypothetical protein
MTTKILLEISQYNHLICPRCGSLRHTITGFNIVGINEISELEIQLSGECGHKFIFSLNQDRDAVRMDFQPDAI